VKRRPRIFLVFGHHIVWHQEEPTVNSWNGRATIFITRMVFYLFILFIVRVSEMPRLWTVKESGGWRWLIHAESYAASLVIYIPDSKEFVSIFFFFF
jgi:hypothetical protein